MIVHTQTYQILPQLLMELFDTLPSRCRQIEHMHEGVWFKNIIFNKNDSYENFDNFPLILHLYMQSALMGNQHIPQLLMYESNTLLIQCRHIENIHEGVWFKKYIVLQNNSYENLRQFLPNMVFVYA